MISLLERTHIFNFRMYNDNTTRDISFQFLSKNSDFTNRLIKKIIRVLMLKEVNHRNDRFNKEYFIFGYTKTAK